LPALLGQKRRKPIREALVTHSWYGQFAIRQGPWKLILGTDGSGGFVTPNDARKERGPGQLYNLAEDPSESRNLYAAKPEIVTRLSALLDKYKAQGHSAR
jgi:arylsulfatase A-like enzyme